MYKVEIMQWLQFLRTELAPRPGRLEDTLRITIFTLLVVILTEVFQTPLPAYSAYIVFFVSKEERASTFLTGVIVTLSVTVAVFLALAIYIISAGEPGLRLPLMALIVFIGMFFSRTSSLGLAAFAIGFLVTLSLTLIDFLPHTPSIPTTQLLTKSVLWLWAIVMLPVSVVIFGNTLTGRDPIVAELPIQAKKEIQKPLHQLLVPDAFSNSDYVHYAIKTTLAIFIAYITYNMIDWPGIRTCLITCFFVALGTLAETLHKMILRLAGAIIGGVLGLGTVIFIMPYLTTITGLSLVIAAITFCAAWVATSSERLSYAGLQIALAFFLCILVGYGPQIELTPARDRVIGVIFGNLIIFVIFTLIWPTRATVNANRSGYKRI
jgi:uncharacterized membrane protein YccC